MTEREVEMVHGPHAIATLTDGEQIPITGWVDSDGEECGPDDDPVAAIAGPDTRGNWWAIDLGEFDPVVMQ